MIAKSRPMNPTENGIPTILYHYTPPPGALGIFSSRSVWATKVQFLSDAKEFKEAVGVARWHFGNKKKHAASEQLRTMCDLLGDAVERVEQINVFVFSMSEQQNVLSQWRAYCPHGGFAVGFNVSELVEVAEQHGFHLARCAYNIQEHRRLLAPVIDHAIAAAERELAERPGPLEEVRERIIAPFFEAFVNVAPLVKNSAFEEEKEWRLISAPIASNSPEIKYRATPSLIVPYYDLPLLRPDNTMVKCENIVMGPGLHRELMSQAISLLVSRDGIRWGGIEYSQIPYRVLI